MIPKNINESHIKSAIEYVKNNGVPNSKRKSKEYYLVFDDKLYPPKYIISKANEYANGEFLNHREFNAKQARDFVEERNFKIRKIDKHLTNKIEEAINSDFIQMLKNENKYYFQKLLDVKDKFLNHKIPNKQLEYILKEYENFTTGTFEDFVIFYDDVEEDFLNILGEFISYLDEKAAGKVKWNKYEDSRTIAQAGVRQDRWVDHLIKFKINTNHVPSDSIHNALNYAIYPSKNVTILSENHRKKLSQFLFEEAYNKENFTQNFINFFEPFDIEVNNQLNYTYLLSGIVYSENFKQLWKPKAEKRDSIYSEFEKFLGVEDYDEKMIETYLNSIKDKLPKYFQKIKKEKFNPANLNVEYLKTVLQVTTKNFGGSFNGKLIFQDFLKDYINLNEENTMEMAEIFKQFKQYLDEERKDLASSSKQTYVLNAVGEITKYYKVYYKTDIASLPVNYILVKQLSKMIGKVTGYKGIASFQSFIKFLVKKHPKPKNTTLNKIFFGPPGTGKTFRIIEDYITAAETHIEKVDASKKMIDLKKGFWHLAPGEGGYLWEDLKKNDYLGYEWCSHYLGDLSKVSRDEPHWDMKKRFSKVKEGDYICIISGKKFYALARALHSYDLDKSKNLDFDFQTIKVEWVKKFEQPELLNTYSTQSFSNLKGSKRWQSLLDALESQDIYPKDKEGKEVKKSVKNYSLVSFHQSFSYEDFIEGIKPDLENEDNDESDIRYIIQDGIFKQSCDKAARLAGYEDLYSCLEDTKEGRLQSFQNALPFYLLIDEINRGNISAIFGELITLIEKDKRLGNDYELMTDLPYSKKQFGVPANLHIIGTMNTADRSVEALDTALRRRFSFIEVAPNTDILKDKHTTSGVIESDIDLIKLLEKINERIELLINKDHKIGHSYFLKVSSLKGLKKVFTDKVIPLLEEYFYGDYGKIGLVLGSRFVEKVEDKNKTDFADFSYEDKQALREKMIYKFTPYEEWIPKDFISIYNPAILKEVE